MTIPDTMPFNSLPSDALPCDCLTTEDPIAALLAAGEPGVLAVITAVEGPAYRLPGAMMAILASGRRVGGLSSGCIEGDLALHARAALEDGRMRRLRYGAGSPFADLPLPCGGALEVTVLPHPSRAALAGVAAAMARRAPVGLAMDGASGALSLALWRPTGWAGGQFLIELRPDVRFLIFGSGPETAAFARTVQGAGYPHLLVTDDGASRLAALGAGCCVAADGDASAALAGADARTAITLFFHDHEREGPILQAALATPAFYIGAQGSRRASATRRGDLVARGVAPEEAARVRGPIGLVTSARDSRVLAVSVLAEVLDLAEG